MHAVIEPGERHISGLGNLVSSQHSSEASKLLDGLNALATWSSNLDQHLIDEMLSIDLPFGQVSLAGRCAKRRSSRHQCLERQSYRTTNVGQRILDDRQLSNDRWLTDTPQ